MYLFHLAAYICSVPLKNVKVSYLLKDKCFKAVGGGAFSGLILYSSLLLLEAVVINSLSLRLFYVITGYHLGMNAVPLEKKTELGKLAFSGRHYSYG